ncbi:MAG: TMEM165/GDT1 family protein [Planctomycetota bacterium]|nr:TMEM165/GDT1 family protein [Planctomycetota bacterium]
MQESWATFAAAFAAVFVAELGDKTQLAALGLAAGTRHPLAVLLGSILALSLAAALAVGLGRLLREAIDPRALHYAGAALFVAIGLVMLVRGPAVAQG